VRIIYEPRGRAAEYAKLAASGYRYCNHGCRYCFNPLAQHCTAEEFTKPVVRQGVLALFEKDCKELAAAGDQREILLSFSTDPYNELEDRYHVTREMINILNKHGLHFTLLTKGKRPLRDIELLLQRPDLCRFGTTLTFRVDKDQLLWEPGAAPWRERVDALYQAHENGIRTWVSMEPVIYPIQTTDLISTVAGFVDEFRIGKFNHTPALQPFMDSIGYIPPTDAELILFVKSAKILLDGYHCRYIFKKDLQPYLPGGG
jgi:DNA repair photolyase